MAWIDVLGRLSMLCLSGLVFPAAFEAVSVSIAVSLIYLRYFPDLCVVV
jgi:hypothetical protein